ncbi:uncharacterized protein LOC110457376 [Mizuhopecten yessoensis]|uniref:Alpha-1,4-N-acetylglucosaminyltransferase n=1 Tax=Mizuhopecten yessoensis TaxID=6573 RepID=A0A210Q8Z5_MIZYE|nr:uncharacterized protein LOC110457376 [Mizuhopecten yessoensis]OWF45185.1 hypothetical protein KP79_PYT23610 [Mizuhopecten yessoensis]
MAKRHLVRICGRRTSVRSIAQTVFVGFSLIFVLRHIDLGNRNAVLEGLRPVTTREHAIFSISDQLRLRCEERHSTLYLTSTEDEQVLSVKSDDRCFSRALRNYCPETPGRRVPNIVHYIWFGIKNMTFYQLVSFLSVQKFQKPCVILVHGNVVPIGPYWRHLVHNASNIVHVKMTPPYRVTNGHILRTMTHKSNIARLMVLQEHGGIYLDLDTVLLRSLDPLMNYPVSMSMEYKSNLWNGLIVAERDPLFIRHWITLFNQQYYYAHKKKFEFSLFLPTYIAKAHPSWIHVENMTFCTPNGNHLHMIYKENFDWKENYAMHLYIRYYKVHDDFTSVRRLNATIGALARLVLYSTKDLLED